MITDTRVSPSFLLIAPLLFSSGALGSFGSPKKWTSITIQVSEEVWETYVVYIFVNLTESISGKGLNRAFHLYYSSDNGQNWRELVQEPFSLLPRTDDNGLFRGYWSQSLKPGEYLLKAEWEGDDEYYGCSTTKKFTIIPVFQVKIRVLRASGAPLVGADITVNPVNASWSLLGITDSNGTYMCDLAKKSYNIAIEYKTVTYQQTIDIVETATVEIRTPICSVGLQVLRPSGQPLTYVPVTVTPFNSSSPRFTNTTDSTGTMTLELLKGRYTVEVNYTGLIYKSTLDVVGDIVEGIDIPLSTVKLRIIGESGQPLIGANVTISPWNANEPVFKGLTDINGTILLELLKEPYNVIIEYKGFFERKRVEIAGDETREIRTSVFIELFGRPLTFRLTLFIVLLIVLALAPIGAFSYRKLARKRLLRRSNSPPTED